MNGLQDPGVRDALRKAWEDSQSETPTAHEEGGFVLRAPDGSWTVARWPRGSHNEIVVPPHPGGQRDSSLIVATFHTHPNPGADYQQEPSLTDIRAVRDDPDLGHTEYEGEYVIAREAVYRILRDGRVEHLGDSQTLLGPP